MNTSETSRLYIPLVHYPIWSVIALVCLCLGGCDSSNSAFPQKHLTLLPEFSIEEHALKDMPTNNDESVTFVPVEGTQEDVSSKHQAERNKRLPDTSYFENFRYSFSATVNGQKIVAT